MRKWRRECAIDTGFLYIEISRSTVRREWAEVVVCIISEGFGKLDLLLEREFQFNLLAHKVTGRAGRIDYIPGAEVGLTTLATASHRVTGLTERPAEEDGLTVYTAPYRSPESLITYSGHLYVHEERMTSYLAALVPALTDAERAFEAFQPTGPIDGTLAILNGRFHTLLYLATLAGLDAARVRPALAHAAPDLDPQLREAALNFSLGLDRSLLPKRA